FLERFYNGPDSSRLALFCHAGGVCLDGPSSPKRGDGFPGIAPTCPKPLGRHAGGRTEMAQRPHVEDSLKANPEAEGVQLAAARRSEERFRLAAEALNGIIYDADLLTGRVERTRGLFEVVGYRPEDVSSTADWWTRQIHPDDRAKAEAELSRAMAAGEER